MLVKDEKTAEVVSRKYTYFYVAVFNFGAIRMGDIAELYGMRKL